MAVQTAGILPKTPQFLENVIKLKSWLFLKLFFYSYQSKFKNVTAMNCKE